MEDVRRLVREQYDKYPYPMVPPDVEARAPYPTPGLQGAMIFPRRASCADLDVLVAGCGSFSAAAIARTSPGCRVLGIDISRASLESTRQLAEKWGLTNLRLVPCAIEDVATLGETFDYIDCSGVLHHLADPVEGLRALKGVLRPDGAMHVMLYGEYGRHGVYLLQEACRTLGLGQDQYALGVLRRLLPHLMRRHPIRDLVRTSDLTHDAGLVDLFLHAQDQAYTVPKIYAHLEAAGLQLQRFVFPGLYDPRTYLPDSLVNLIELQNLSPMDSQKLAELLHGKLELHQFLCVHRERSLEPLQLDWSSPRWTSWIIRQNGRLEIDQDARLQPGMHAAVRMPLRGFVTRFQMNRLECLFFNQTIEPVTIAAAIHQSGLRSAPGVTDVEAFVRAFVRRLADMDVLLVQDPEG